MADANPQPANENGGTRDLHCSKAKNDSGKDGNAADDAKNTDDNNTTKSGDTEQVSADSADGDKEIVSAQIAAGPAVAFILTAADTAPAPSAKSSDKACGAPNVAPPAAPTLFNAAFDGAPPPDAATTAQVTPDGQSADAGDATQPAPAVAGAPTETDGDAASALTAVVTAPRPKQEKNPPAADVVASTPVTESSDPVDEGALAAAAAVANSKPIFRAATIETAKSETGKSGADSSEIAKSDTDKLEVGKPEIGKSDEVEVPPQAKPRGNGGSVHVDSAAAGANLAAAATNGQPAKNEGTKSENGTTNGAHHAVAEQIFNIAQKSESPGQIPDSASVKVPTDNAPVLNSTLQVPQTIAPAQTISAPAIAAVAAIPLAALPIEIAARAKNGVNRFEIRLDPPELGRIDVRLDIDRSGHVTSRLMVERPETLDLLRRDAPQIERALQDAGLKTSDLGMQFSLRDQSFSDQNDPLPSATSLVLPQDDIVPLEAMRQGYGRLFGLGGGIDIRV